MKLILFCLFSVLACFQGHPTNLFQRGKLSKLYHLAKNGDKVEMDLTHLTIGEDKLRTEGKEEPGDLPTDCSGWYNKGYNESGIYAIQPGSKGSFTVYCDMKTAEGGWTVIQRRADGSVDFYRSWNDYKIGFGPALANEFWLGNDKIHRIVSGGRYVIRFDLKNKEGKLYFAEYSSFSIGNELEKYKLSVTGYSGNAGDAFGHHNNYSFATKDKDHDQCAVLNKGGWWFTNCYWCFLNGNYPQNSTKPYSIGMVWNTLPIFQITHAEMKIRPYKIPPTVQERDCSDWRKKGYDKNGIYWIQPDGKESFQVYCDMETEGGGWTVIQRRADGSVYFNKDWNDYKEGFGPFLNEEFWLGNEKIYRIVSGGRYAIHFCMRNRTGAEYYAEYSSFSIGNEDSKYRLYVTGYSGNAGDAFGHHSNYSFATKDKDNKDHCATMNKGGWWFSNCYWCFLNGNYPLKSHKPQSVGITWLTLPQFLDITHAEMKIRPFNK